MSVTPVNASRAYHSQSLPRRILLAGTSALMLLAAPNAHAVTLGLGAGGGSVTAGAMNAAQSGAQQAQQAAQNAQQAMGRATQALQALQALQPMQAAAQAAALAAQQAVPNGLALRLPAPDAGLAGSRITNFATNPVIPNFVAPNSVLPLAAAKAQTQTAQANVQANVNTDTETRQAAVAALLKGLGTTTNLREWGDAFLHALLGLPADVDLPPWSFPTNPPGGTSNSPILGRGTPPTPPSPVTDPLGSTAARNSLLLSTALNETSQALGSIMLPPAAVVDPLGKLKLLDDGAM